MKRSSSLRLFSPPRNVNQQRTGENWFGGGEPGGPRERERGAVSLSKGRGGIIDLRDEAVNWTEERVKRRSSDR